MAKQNMNVLNRIKNLEAEIKEMEDALEWEEFGSCTYDYLSADLTEAEIELLELRREVRENK